MRATARALPALCEHCRFPTPAGETFCCAGCRAAHSIISEAGLTDFYELRGDVTGGPPKGPGFESSRLWREATVESIVSSSEPIAINVGISGLYCAACVWLIERSLTGLPGVHQTIVNPARGSAELIVSSEFDFDAAANRLAALGYRLTEPCGETLGDSDELLARTGIAFAIALNAVLIAAAIYFGLDGWLHDVFTIVSVVLGAGAVAVGGSYFGGRALAALRARAVSLDVPIALGIFAVFGASLWAVVVGRDAAVYFDSVAVFVALMLAGRLLQQRLLVAHRARATSEAKLIDLSARVIRDGRPTSVRAVDLRIGDTIIVVPDDIVFADIELLDERAACALDWIQGESAPRLFRAGDVIPAGASNASRVAFTGTVVTPLADTVIPQLLSMPTASTLTTSATSRTVASIYLGAVLVAAGVGFAAWLFSTGDGARSLEVAAAILVVTCPCALGIGAPLAFELTASRLAREGAFIRTPEALPNLAKIRLVAFDKTGTVTESVPMLADPRSLTSLDAADRHALFNLASRSRHPQSRAILEALEGSIDVAITVTERAGLGLEATIDSATYRLGRASWAISGQILGDADDVDDVNDEAGEAGDAGLVFAKNGSVLSRPNIVESLRPDAVDELSRLRERGLSLSLISGDRDDRVRKIASSVGIDEGSLVSEAKPQDKASWVRAHDRGDLLFVGDGLNDTPALELATVSATPSFESPLIAGRVDIYFNGRGLKPIRLAIEAAHRLRRIERAQLAFVIVYNTAAVSVALSGAMQPWLAAVLMPTSSLAVVLFTAFACRRGATNS